MVGCLAHNINVACAEEKGARLEFLCELWCLQNNPNLAPFLLRMIWIERFFNLWSRNQWKRERFAPSFHLDDESLDPKTWCRFPILSGGYAEELAEMKEKQAEL